LEFSNGFLTQKELDPDFIAANSQSRRYHFPARFYVPFRAIFAQIDPQSMMSAGNKRALYLYVMANPLLFVDPDGRDYVSDAGYQLSSGSNISPGYGLGMDVVNPNAAPGTANVITVGIGMSATPSGTSGTANPQVGAGGYSSMMTSSGLLQTWVCSSGAVYNYVNMGGGIIQNPCLPRLVDLPGTFNNDDPCKDACSSYGRGFKTITLKCELPGQCDRQAEMDARTMAKANAVQNGKTTCEARGARDLISIGYLDESCECVLWTGVTIDSGCNPQPGAEKTQCQHWAIASTLGNCQRKS
jgi:hypothetical protein